MAFTLTDAQRERIRRQEIRMIAHRIVRTAAGCAVRKMGDGSGAAGSWSVGSAMRKTFSGSFNSLALISGKTI